MLSVVYFVSCDTLQCKAIQPLKAGNDEIAMEMAKKLQGWTYNKNNSKHTCPDCTALCPLIKKYGKIKRGGGR